MLLKKMQRVVKLVFLMLIKISYIIIGKVFDIKLRNGNARKKEYAFQLGVMGTDLTAEGPFKEGYNGSYLINYRYSTLGILDKVIDFGEDYLTSALLRSV